MAKDTKKDFCEKPWKRISFKIYFLSKLAFWIQVLDRQLMHRIILKPTFWFYSNHLADSTVHLVTEKMDTKKQQEQHGSPLLASLGSN